MSQSPSLSPEGEQRKLAHAFLLGEYAEGKKVEIRGEGESAVLNEIVIATEPIDIKSGDSTLQLPPGSQRVASMFRYLLFRGEGLNHIESMTLVPYDKTGTMTVSTREVGLFRVKVPAMPIPRADMATMQIEVRCKAGHSAKITEIAFNSQGKLPLKFDSIPYRNLGAEFPRQKVSISVDLQSELSIDGHVDLEREKFCRYYAAPGQVHESFENWAAERNFLPGRQMMKFQPALVKGYSKKQPKLKESASTKGAADLTFFDAYNNIAGVANTIEPFRKIDYAMCFNDYPEFMSIENVGRGTPRVEHFDKAAQLAAAYLADQIKDTGRTATWWEVKNESTIKAEWDYHWRDKNAWKHLADFHNLVAEAVHESSPEVKIGGPSSAWMQLQVKDFSLYKNQRDFMDATRDYLDFYSHHFYEDIGTLGAWERRGGAYTNYLLGRVEAIMNMLQAHMHSTDNIKPILVTEVGSLQPGRGPSDYWLRLRSFSAYMNKFMQRPNEVDLLVPFSFMTLPWNPQSGDASFIPREGEPNHSAIDKCDPTPVTYFFELWKDFDGRRLSFEIDESENTPYLDVTALHQGNKVQLAITNMGGRQLSIDLKTLSKGRKVLAAEQRRLYYRDGEVVYEEANSLTEITAIPVDVEETTVVTLELDQPLDIQKTRERKFWYAADTAVKTAEGELCEFAIQLDEWEGNQSAKLVVGVERKGGLANRLVGLFNNSTLENEAVWAQEINNLFAPVEFEVSPEVLSQNNKVYIHGQEGLTISSVHLVTER